MLPKRSLPLHPFFFAVYPVAALLASNLDAAPAAAALRPLVVTLLGASLFFLALRQLLHHSLRAALLTTLVLALFFSYGHVYNFLESGTLSGFPLGRHRLLAPAWIAFFLLGAGWATRPRRDLPLITRALNIIGAVLLLLPLTQIAFFQVSTLQAPPRAEQPAPGAQLRLPPQGTAPDIYYLILDGYSRDDLLHKFYDLDNSPFLEQLSQMEFYVARCAQSNYAQTQLSLASSLNYEYLASLDDAFQAGSTSRTGLPGLIQRSAVRSSLESLGYRVVAFETGFEATQLEDADIYLSSGAGTGIEDFESLLIRTTAGRVAAEGIAFLNLKPDWAARDAAHRQRILFALEELRRLPDLPGPKFVFAHLITPHWPHVFGPDGEAVHQRQDSISGYRDQVIFINKMIVPVLAEIIAKSGTPPVIILQGDHGAVIESPERRMAILNAYYLPNGAGGLYESISPVNTFRVIFNQVFAGRLPLLGDAAYYSRYETPFDFQLVPNERPGCPK
jgi:hypothetical protein